MNQVGPYTTGCYPELVHGQRLYFCTPDVLAHAVHLGEFGGAPIPEAYLRVLNPQISLMRRYPELRIGMYLVDFPSGGARLMPYALVELGEASPQRVEVLHTRCESCDWRGYRGSPLVSDIYFGIGEGYDKWELMRTADQYPEVGCPRCGSALPQRPVWVGELPGHELGVG